MRGWSSMRSEQRGVAVDRQPLEGVGEIAIVERVAHRQARDDALGQFARVGRPLLGGIAADERLVERPADQRDRLLLEIARGPAAEFRRLRGDQRARFVGREATAEELADRAEVDRHGVDLIAPGGEDPVAIVGESREALHVIPHRFVRRVEQVRAVFVDFDARLGVVLAVGVAADMAAPIDHQDPFAEALGEPLGQRRAVEPGADDQNFRRRSNRSSHGGVPLHAATARAAGSNSITAGCVVAGATSPAFASPAAEPIARSSNSRSPAK